MCTGAQVRVLRNGHLRTDSYRPKGIKYGLIANGGLIPNSEVPRYSNARRRVNAHVSANFCPKQAQHDLDAKPKKAEASI